MWLLAIIVIAPDTDGQWDQKAQSIETVVVSNKVECLELGNRITGPYTNTDFSCLQLGGE